MHLELLLHLRVEFFVLLDLFEIVNWWENRPKHVVSYRAVAMKFTQFVDLLSLSCDHSGDQTRVIWGTVRAAGSLSRWKGWMDAAGAPQVRRLSYVAIRVYEVIALVNDRHYARACVISAHGTDFMLTMVRCRRVRLTILNMSWSDVVWMYVLIWSETLAEVLWTFDHGRLCHIRFVGSSMHIMLG